MPFQPGDIVIGIPSNTRRITGAGSINEVLWVEGKEMGIRTIRPCFPLLNPNDKFVVGIEEFKLYIITSNHEASLLSLRRD